MTDHGMRALEAELRGRVARGLRDLQDEELNDLARAIADARHRQAADLAAAGEQALSFIPRMLRRPILRMFS